MTEAPKTIYLVHETLRESIAKDAITFGGLIGGTLLGWWVGSAALQWIAGLMFLMGAIGRATAEMNRSRMTLDEAQAEIDRLRALSEAEG